VDPGTVAAELADELRLMADWMELDDVAVTGRGDLAAHLAAAVFRPGRWTGVS
jgi:uncharacterized protein YcaQ